MPRAGAARRRDDTVMAAPAPRNHYDVLGIARDADAAQVRTAWKLHVQAWHPDRFTGAMRDEAEGQAKSINEAYTVLRDAGRRAAYDCSIAADERATRSEPSVHRSSKIRPAAPRQAAAPIGSPMPQPEPRTLTEQASVVAADAWLAIRRHPRITAAVAATWFVLVGGSVIASFVAGPTLPAGATTASAASARPSAMSRIEDEQQAEALEDIAARAEAEHVAAERELQAQLEEQARIDAAEEAADARAALAAQAAAKVPKSAKGAAPPAGGGGRVVRVMPQPQ
ncbi:MAG: molecular chaperone DnaJ [Thermoleophilia bacterium]|nr:molecular chaperone DnaJ [Thermoleophilia bacterium]